MVILIGYLAMGGCDGSCVFPQVGEPVPGVGWEMARTEDGRVYYYHGSSRRTTWSIEETWA